MKLTITSRYTTKDQAKSNKATQFIGLGCEGSSTHQYMLDWQNKANTGNYTDKDIVFISINGKRKDRVTFDHIKALVNLAIQANAKFITDNEYDRNRPFNIGEREVANYLTQHEYTDNNGIWTKQNKEIKPMQSLNPMQYLAVDVANQMGLDKLNFEDRINWVKQNLNQLEYLEPQAEEPFLYYKAVRSLRQAMNGEAINHTVALDSASSGLQLMSALMRDIDGCITTGLGDNRIDAYTVVTDEMNRLMKEDGLEEVYVTRKQAKQACMTSAYGSKAVPLEVFGESLLPYFYQAMNNKFKGAMQLQDILIASWNRNENYHSWVMPDNHFVYIPNMESVQKRVNISEINYTPVVQMYEQVYKDKGVANCANFIHSSDGYLLRSVVRRCNYSKPVVQQFMDMSQFVQYKKVDETLYGIDRWKATKLADISVLEHIQYDNISHYPKELIQALRAVCETMLVHEPFEVICIHDSYAVHPNNCEYLRQHYNNVLADMSDSNMLCDLLNQLYQTDDFELDDKFIGDHIRQSSYGIS